MHSYIENADVLVRALDRFFLLYRFPSLLASKVQHLDSRLQAQDARCLLSSLPYIESLDIRDCQIGDELFNVLAPLPSLSSSLKCINFANNELRDSAMRALSVVLPQLPLLLHLYLSKNSFDDAG